MATTVADQVAVTLTASGAKRSYGVVGDCLIRALLPNSSISIFPAEGVIADRREASALAH